MKLSGGEGRFSGTFFGILIISIINTIFNYAGNLNSWWQNIVMGGLILVSIGLQSDIFHFSKKQNVRKACSHRGGESDEGRKT